MEEDFNALAIELLINKSKSLFCKGCINKLEHLKNLKYIHDNLDGLVIVQKNFETLEQILSDNNEFNTIIAEINRLLIQRN